MNSLLRYTHNRLVRVSTIVRELQERVSLLLVNVSLLDHFPSFIISELLVHVFHVELNLCTRLQLCSTAPSSRSDSSLAGSSTRSLPAVSRQSSEPAGRSSPPIGGHRLRYHVCLKTGVFWSAWMMRHCIFDFTFVSLVSGHPRPPDVTAPVYCGCPCHDPLGCLRCPSKMASGAERQPLWLRCLCGGGHVCGRSSFTRSTSTPPRNHLSVPYGMHISVEKMFFTMRVNLLHHIPRNCLRFP